MQDAKDLVKLLKGMLLPCEFNTNK